MKEINNNNIVQNDYNETIKTNSTNYFYSVILDRAIADVRDGLKPVQRRIIYCANEIGNTSSKVFKKSTKIMSGVLENYSPHGDSSVFDAMVRMGQDFTYNPVLIDLHGNNGSISGDPSAAMRYLEARLHKNAEIIYLPDIHNNSVDMKDNYDNTIKEPTVLPARTCMLLVNGVSGIAAGGWSSEVPSHSLVDVCEMVKRIIKKPELTLQDIATSIRPSFPNGGILCSDDDITKGYITGRWNVRCRVNIRYDEKKNSLIIYGLAPSKKLDKLMENIRDKSRPTSSNPNPVINEIKDIVDLSSMKNGIYLKIQLKQGVDPTSVENKLYKYTECETTIKMILSATNNNEFKIYNIKEIFTTWLDFRRDTIRRVNIYNVKSKQKKIHILEGQVIILNDLDNALKLIRSCSDKENVKSKLMKKYDLTELQAENIANTPLYRISSLEIKKIEDEMDTLKADVKALFIYINDPKAIDNTIIEEQDELIKKCKYKPKTTTIINIDRNLTEEDFVEEKTYMLTLSKNLYIKRVEPNLKVRKRGAKGQSNGKVRDNDFIEKTFYANSKDHLLLFTNKGTMYDIKIWQIPECELGNIGSPLKSIITKLKLDEGEDLDIKAVLCITNTEYESDKNFLCFATKNGLVKKTLMSNYRSNRSSLLAIKFKEGDELVDVRYIYDGYLQDIFLATKNGNAIRFDPDQVTTSLRPTYGMTGIKLKGNDKVVAFDLIQDDDGFITTISSDGYGKNVKINNPVKVKFDGGLVDRNTGFENQNRGGSGKIIAKLRKGSTLVKAIVTPTIDDNIIVTSSQKIVSINVASIPFTLRATLGSTIMKLKDKEKVVDLTLISDNSEAEEE